MTDTLREQVRTEVGESAPPPARLKQVLHWAGIPASTFFHRRVGTPRKRGRPPRPLDEDLVAKVVSYAELYPWWGYKRLAVVMRREGVALSNHFVRQVFRLKKLFKSRRRAPAELYQAAKLFELLPSRANQLWQADVSVLQQGSGRFRMN